VTSKDPYNRGMPQANLQTWMKLQLHNETIYIEHAHFNNIINNLQSDKNANVSPVFDTKH
jgi:hypothetical protein